MTVSVSCCLASAEQCHSKCVCDGDDDDDDVCCSIIGADAQCTQDAADQNDVDGGLRQANEREAEQRNIIKSTR